MQRGIPNLGRQKKKVQAVDHIVAVQQNNASSCTDRGNNRQATFAPVHGRMSESDVPAPERTESVADEGKYCFYHR